MSTQQAPLRVGGETLSLCTKCKLVLGHTIVSMSDKVASKVKCNTCKGIHRFKDPSSQKARTLSSPKTGVLSLAKERKKIESEMNIWDVSVKNFAGLKKSYSVQDKFNIGDVISHPQFGPGLVESLLERDKIHVIFQFGQKTLLHNKK
jgi:hypothetical protein